MSQKPILDWRYAIGEIIIVIISITIAFALNSWAGARKDRAKAAEYLENLQKDLSKDQASLQALDARIDSALQNHWAIARHFYAPMPGRDTIAFLFFKELNRSFDFFPQNATFESLRYSGDFQLIKKVELKNEIVDHYNQYAVLKKNYNVYEASQRDYTYRYFYENHEFAKMNNTDGITFLEDPKFTNLVFSNIGLLGRMEKAVKETEGRCAALIKHIEEL